MQQGPSFSQQSLVRRVTLDDGDSMFKNKRQRLLSPREPQKEPNEHRWESEENKENWENNEMLNDTSMDSQFSQNVYSQPTQQTQPSDSPSSNKNERSEVVPTLISDQNKVFELTGGELCCLGEQEYFCYTIGRRTGSFIKTESTWTSHDHASIYVPSHVRGDESYNKDSAIILVPEGKKCSVKKGREWKDCFSAEKVYLFDGDKFALTRQEQEKGVQFTLHCTSKPKSFDERLRELLFLIDADGVLRNNKKGSNKTYPQAVNLEIDLFSSEGHAILPYTTLRHIGSRPAMIEALWYLRGQEDISFLQANNIRFWDAQARDKSWVGLNYGLLVNWGAGQAATNQLEQKVIRPLMEGRSSRNMICSLTKPDEETVQQACTGSVQFAVSERDNQDCLDLTVNQRSSDVMLGLPHDVVVWSVILHLVVREVQPKRPIKAGKLIFLIAAGGAHVYDMNMEQAKQLRQQPARHCPQPHLVIADEAKQKSIFQLANTYANGNGEILIKDYPAGLPRINIRQAV